MWKTQELQHGGCALSLEKEYCPMGRSRRKMEGLDLWHLVLQTMLLAGDVVRIDPAGERCIKADDQEAIKFICIQTEAKSLVQFTQNDGVPSEAKPSWY